MRRATGTLNWAALLVLMTFGAPAGALAASNICPPADTPPCLSATDNIPKIEIRDATVIIYSTLRNASDPTSITGTGYLFRACGINNASHNVNLSFNVMMFRKDGSMITGNGASSGNQPPGVIPGDANPVRPFLMAVDFGGPLIDSYSDISPRVMIETSETPCSAGNDMADCRKTHSLKACLYNGDYAHPLP